jgi:Flp pilus assembly protein TadD
MRLISIIVTTLDFAPYVVPALRSVQDAIDLLRRQPQAPEVEVVVVDDGSRDETPRLVREFLSDRQGWLLHERTPSGDSPSNASAARNAGVACSRGDVLCFLDGDDLWRPDHLVVCWQSLQPPFDFVKTGVHLADPVHPDWQRRIEGSLVINLAVRRACHEAVGGFPDWHLQARSGRDGSTWLPRIDLFRLHEDQFYNRSLTRRFRGVGVHQATVEYRRRPGNAYDRQLAKFQQPPHSGETSPPERLRLHLADLLAEGWPSEMPIPETLSPVSNATIVHALAPQVWVPDAQMPDAQMPHTMTREQAQRQHDEGLSLAQRGELERALTLLRSACRVCPHEPTWQHNLGVALAQAGQAVAAQEALRAALALRPDYAEAWYNLGAVQATVGPDREAAIESYRQAVRYRPDYYEAHNNLGLALVEALQPEPAVVHLRQAARLRPESAEAWNNLGLALTALGRHAEAESALERSLALRPVYADAHNNLAGLYREAGRLPEALAQYDLALRHDPASESLRYNRSLALLQMGQWAEGWREYAHRWRRGKQERRHDHLPAWTGDLPAGMRVLLWAEQGLGDTVQFALFAVEVARRGAERSVRVVLEVPPPLRRLLGALAQGQSNLEVLAEGEPVPTCQAQAPLMDLPGLLGCNSPERLPPAGAYLSAEPTRIERARAWLRERAGEARLRVGVVWRGNPHFGNDRWRSFPLAALAPLARVPGVRLIGLQRERAESERVPLLWPEASLGESLGGESGWDKDGAFVDSAALLTQLDLLVSADTSMGHVAGALGVPCWLALSRAADWRWLDAATDGGETTRWYAGHRLYRQAELGRWEPVFEAMARDLSAWATRVTKVMPGSHRIEVNAGELLDRLSILALKADRLGDPRRREHVLAERSALERVRAEATWPSEVEALRRELDEVNAALWDVEDRLRHLEAASDFGKTFVDAARSVYRLNDRRAALKRAISETCGSAWIEQKLYGG